jgi:photosystem II stability/assembly factor-like uncharacterized protein
MSTLALSYNGGYYILHKSKIKMKSKHLVSVVILVTCLFKLTYSQYNWEQISVPDSTEVRSIYFHDEDSYLGTENGVYYSNDQFETIEHIGLENKNILTMLMTSNGELLTSSTGVIYKYLGNGEWQNLSYIPSSAICMYESENGDLFIGSWGYIHKSTDQGNTWNIVFESYNMEGINGIIDGTNGLLFAGSASLVGVGHPGGLYRSDDNGDSWELVSLEYHFISSIVSNSQYDIFVGTRGHWQTSEGHVFRSNDSLGLNWEDVYSNNLVADMDINEFGTLFIGCKSELNIGGVYCSFNNGDTWEDISGNLPHRYISKIEVSSENLVYILMYATNNLYRLTDTITSVPTNSQNNISIYPNPTTSNIIVEITTPIKKIIVTSVLSNSIADITTYETINNALSIDLSNYKRGVYLVTIITDNHVFTKTIIKR